MPTKQLKVMSQHNGGISVRKKRLLAITVSRGFEDCGAQGISNMARAQTTQARILWAILTIAAISLCTVMAVDLVQKYYRFEYDVTLKISFKPQLDFPVITICNLNPMLRSEMIKRPIFRPLYGRDFESVNTSQTSPLVNNSSLSNNTVGQSDSNSSTPLPTNKVPQDATAAAAASTVAANSQGGTAAGSTKESEKTATPTGTKTSLPRVKKSLSSDVNENIDRPTPPPGVQFENLDKSHENYHLFSEISAELFNRLTDQRMYELGTQASNFIAKCTFKQKPCAANFNTGNSRGKRIESVNYPGPLFGLQLYLDINKAEYISREVPTAGVRIAVTPQGVRPNPEDEGFDVPPGALTSIGLKMRNISRLSTPYNKEGCLKHPPNNKTLNIYENGSDRYSYKGCIKSCIASLQNKTCGCIAARYSFTSSTKGLKVCSLKNETEINCQSRLQNRFIAGKINCGCVRACNEQSFEATTSQAQFPSEVNLDNNNDLLEYFKRDLTKFQLTRKTVTPFLRKNLVAVNIYYEELNFETIEQTPRYSEIDLASDIGGVLGLWIGISVLTVFEFMEILVDSLLIIFGKEKIASRRNTITEFKAQLQASGLA
ncbi:uncharacterized protein TRIADDRAFT_54579 [Trichoplax adhaerens]|uniref:Uncharacterized protein n=1 Tax=Trichoplax adhaerens TaxID=10228 RepID=B3RSF6_TRIAD|nr:hypothetical protein TRIADDRAFT_54579 [Trichoplax adhaerens]EDV26506.1 hypothetical protein TRIADDRAFT_54579 [Trichoplax adhaerens]|eukprot:XP_002110502.1 hypothetical protein TRIADDRAFT_54579 [Trichoplax adhaerens]